MCWTGSDSAGYRRPAPDEEKMVVCRVSPDGHIELPGEATHPCGQVSFHRDLVIAPTLENEHGLVQRGRYGGRLVRPQVDPVGRRDAEGQVARWGRR